MRSMRHKAQIDNTYDLKLLLSPTTGKEESKA